MVNRQRFLRRYKSQIKQSIAEAINKRSVTDVDSGSPSPSPLTTSTNRCFIRGAAVRAIAFIRATTTSCRTIALSGLRADQAVAAAVATPADGEGQDEFVFQISKDEYLDLLFEDLALPNLKRTSTSS